MEPITWAGAIGSAVTVLGVLWKGVSWVGHRLLDKEDGLITQFFTRHLEALRHTEEALTQLVEKQAEIHEEIKSLVDMQREVADLQKRVLVIEDRHTHSQEG